MDIIIDEIPNRKRGKIIAPSGVGDVPLMLYCATLGNSYFIDETMSCYRRMSIGSWTKKNSSINSKINLREKLIKLSQEYNTCTKNIFNNEISNAILNWNYEIDLFKGNYISCCTNRYHNILKNKALKYRLKIKFRACLQLLKKILNS